MAVIQINAASTKRNSKEFVEGNNRRKFLVNIIKTDPANIVPTFADKAQKAVVVWIALEAQSKSGEKFNPADQLTKLLETVKAAGKGERLHLKATIRGFQMSEPTSGTGDNAHTVYQDLTVDIDDSAEKSVHKVAPAPWDFTDANL